MNNHIGTWRMVRAVARDADGNPRPTPYGPEGMGLVTLNANGRMMAVLCDGRKALPDGTERAYGSYCGNYTFDGTTLVTKVDACDGGRARMGSDQVRKVRFEGGLMVLEPPPATVGGVLEYREVFWERISPSSA